MGPGNIVKSDLQTRLADQRASLAGTEALRQTEKERSVGLCFDQKLNITCILADYTETLHALKTRELKIVSFHKQRPSLTLQRNISIRESQSGEEIRNFWKSKLRQYHYFWHFLTVEEQPCFFSPIRPSTLVIIGSFFPWPSSEITDLPPFLC